MRPLAAAVAATLVVSLVALGCSSPPPPRPTTTAKPSAENPPPRAIGDGPEVQLYTLRVGEASFADAGFFSDTGEYDGKPGRVVCTCYLVKHPKGLLLWDTGLSDALADKKDASPGPSGVQMRVETKLVDQLATLKLAPKDITYLAFSHFHSDHTGNANLFTDSEWILNSAELAWATSPQAPPTLDPKSWSKYTTVKKEMIDGDHDVFGDGSVRILRAPGHTPGHQVLFVKLRETGPVILSGDLYHLRESFEHSRVPGFNWDRAQTLASFNRIETILKNTGARLIIQHDPGDVKALPVVPDALK